MFPETSSLVTPALLDSKAFFTENILDKISCNFNFQESLENCPKFNEKRAGAPVLAFV